MGFLARFQQMIDEYNSGAANVQEFFARLLAFVRELNEEDQRAIAEQLSEEELAVFDLLTKPAIMLSQKDRREVKRVARDLLETLKREKLVLDWRKKRDAPSKQTVGGNAATRLPLTVYVDAQARACTIGSVEGCFLSTCWKG